MKKYILSLFIVGFTLISFSNATNLNINCEMDGEGGEYCSPDHITLDTNSCIDGSPTISISNYSCEFPEDYEEDSKYCGIALYDGIGENYINIGYYNGELIESSCNINNDNTEFEVHTYAGDSSFNGTLIIPGNTGGGDSGGGDSGGGDSGGGSSGSGESSDLIDSVSPVIDGLSDTITEFGPYLIYIALGILGCVVGFFAIKRLVNRIRAKILSMFK